jgi:hypothetical protein
MSGSKGKDIIFAGFATDLSKLPPHWRRLATFISENDEHGADTPRDAAVVYLFSEDTEYSTQLLSLFTYLHQCTSPSTEVVVDARDDPNTTMRVFPFAAESDMVKVSHLMHLREILWPHGSV